MRPVFFIMGVLWLCEGKVDHSNSEGMVDKAKEERHADISQKDGELNHERIYVELFKQKRRDHMSAVQSIAGIEIDKQRPFLEEILKNIRNILIESREILERTRYEPVLNSIPQSPTLRDALSKVFENIAFFSDLSLRFPSMVRPKLKDVKTKTAIVWAYELTKKVEVVDEETLKIMNMMGQEMGLIAREEGYENPYGKEKTKEEREREAYEEMKKRREEKNKAKKHDTKIKKGPKMSRSEL